MFRSLKFLIGSALLVMLPSGVLADDGLDNIVDKPSAERLVNDFAGVFTSGERELLENRLVAFDDSTSNQICVVTVEDLSGYDVAQYALLLGNKWGVGGHRNNGIVILIKSRSSREPYIDVSIQTGRGLEGAIPDVYASRIIRNIMGPKLKEDRYFDAVCSACDELIALASGEISEPRDKNADDSLKHIAFSLLLLFIIFLFISIIISSGKGKGKGGSNGSSGGSSGSGGIWPLFIPTGSRGGFSGGGLGGGLGGFGGFGGGSFGGGGASGRF